MRDWLKRTFSFTGNPAGVRIALLVVFILIIGGAMGWCSDAEAQDRLGFGFGQGLAGSEACFGVMLISQELNDRKWLGYMVTHGETMSCRNPPEPIAANIGAGIIRTTHLKKWTFGVGAGVFEHGDVVVGPITIRDNLYPRIDHDIQLVAALFARRNVGERWAVDFLHNSSGGSTHFNRGLNTIVVSFLVGGD